MSAHPKYVPDPVPAYEPEYSAPANTAWQKNYKLPAYIRQARPLAKTAVAARKIMEAAAMRAAARSHAQSTLRPLRPLLQFPKLPEPIEPERRPEIFDTPVFNSSAFDGPSFNGSAFDDAPMPMLFLTRPRESPTPADGRARLAYHIRGVEEACQILEDDPGVGSWDIEPLERRLRELRCKFRRRERGEE